jgi:Zn-dependent peptidase ImmA (M78 family)
MSGALSAASAPDLAAAIRRVYLDAGLKAAAVRPGVVPLYHLVGAYPLRVAEVPNLTYGSARDYLSKETRQRVPVPQDGDVKLSGFLYIYRYARHFYGCILIRREDPVARRRFSVAHELGHYVLHFLPMLQQPAQDGSLSCVITEGLTVAEEDTEAAPVGQLWISQAVSSQPNSPAPDVTRMEDEANRFAAELLMPEPAVRRLAHQCGREAGHRRSVLARRLAPEFLVSRQAMIRRLEELDLPVPEPGSAGAEAAQAPGEATEPWV